MGFKVARFHFDFLSSIQHKRFIFKLYLKGVVDFSKKLLVIIYSTLMSSKMSMSFFLQSKRNEGF